MPSVSSPLGACRLHLTACRHLAPYIGGILPVHHYRVRWYGGRTTARRQIVMWRDCWLPVFESGRSNEHTTGSAVPIFGAGDVFHGALTLSGAATHLEVAESVAQQMRAGTNLSCLLGASRELCDRMYSK